MRRSLLLSALALLVAGCDGGGTVTGGAPGESPSQEGETSVAMLAQNDSGQTGQVSLSPSDDGGTNVVAELSGAQGISQQPFGVYRGTCGALEPEPVYELPPLEEGFFAGTLETPYEDLTAGGLALSVRESAENPDVEAACGEISSEG